MSGGGLKWHGVGTGKTTLSALHNKAKGERQRQALAAPKVGSTAVVCPEDWLALSAAAQEARVRAGADFNPFASAAAIAKEGKRQAAAMNHDESEFAIEHDPEPDAADESARDSKRPKKSVLSHEQLREIELSILELTDELEDQGADADAVDEQCAQMRAQLIEKAIQEMEPKLDTA
ncbi:hypothetical protein M885DRAFT_514306 [Pelagophyceae sp. CCMP2097]|nr:hypothetical protein M885DRAFT_514306 [Pelagophyceae sp. CCMP2097]